MRYFIYIIILLAINAYAAQSDFTFYDTGKSHEYSISRISSQLSSQYGFKVRAFSIIVASEKKSHLFKKQFDYLNKLDAESLSLIYISALSDSADTSGYHTNVEVGKRLLRGQKFRVFIYAPDGNILAQSKKVLSDEYIEEIVKEYNKTDAPDRK